MGGNSGSAAIGSVVAGGLGESYAHLSDILLPRVTARIV